MVLPFVSEKPIHRISNVRQECSFNHPNLVNVHLTGLVQILPFNFALPIKTHYSMYLRTIPLFFACSCAFGQSATASAGGDTAGPNGSISFTIGQIDYISINSSGSVNQGVQQPYELFLLETASLNTDFTITAYPNPVVSFLTIDAGELYSKGLSYVLTDANGRTIIQGDLQEKETQLDVRGLASSSYFLNVFQEDQLVKSYKLIKRIE